MDAATTLPGVSNIWTQPIINRINMLTTGIRSEVGVKVFGTDLDVMKATLEKCITSLRNVPGIVDLDLYRDATIPQLQIVLDRAALARAGITIGAAQDVVRTALGGDVPTEYWQNERPVPVRVIFPQPEREDEERIGNILVPSADGGHVPLREVARIDKAMGKAAINRESNSRVLALKFNIAGRDMGSVVADAMATVKKEVSVPEGNFLAWGGEFENQKRWRGWPSSSRFRFSWSSRCSTRRWGRSPARRRYCSSRRWP